jgi:hypothetical protein
MISWVSREDHMGGMGGRRFKTLRRLFCDLQITIPRTRVGTMARQAITTSLP